MRILILEDNEERIGWFAKNFPDQRLLIVNDAQFAVRLLKAMTFDLAFLDHDLGLQAYAPSDEHSGWAVAVELAEDDRHAKTEVIIHSHNVPAAEKMEDRLKKAGRDVRRALFGTFGRNIRYNG